MARSEAKKAADRRYDAKRRAAGLYRVVAAKMRRDDADALERILQARGLTINAWITRAALDLIATETAQTAQSDGPEG